MHWKTVIRNLQSQATERDRCLKQINSKKNGKKKGWVKLHVYSRKKKEDEMVPAGVNECKSITTALEG